ncbi:MAG: carbohydrate binding family 9 domain-containing protein [Bacteroidales bacterium]|jgi:hypothetical protein|nr:carbohydrate binding family 9 domain-containing protein [Bacteroidales bacterium]
MKDNKLLILIVIILLLPVFYASGQKSISLTPVKNIPPLDGNADDVISLMTSYNFFQLEPDNGKISPSGTKIIVLQSTDTLYIAIACFQNSEVTAKIQMRDKFGQSDDGIFLILGTYNDNRNSYGFGLNPLGTQADFRIMDDGRTLDYNWDTEWSSSAAKYEWGWFAEMAIPFTSLKFKKNINNWQINFRRINREDSEISYWNSVVQDEFKVSLSGNLLNINPPVTKNTFLVVPYGMGKATQTNTGEDKSYIEGQFGGDINWQPSSNLTANITVNPDFATVEADEDVIDLTKYEIRYPEKRIFFQEGNEMYNTRLQTFYSRRIGDISGGVKLTGKAGRTNINLINVFDKNAVDSTGNKPMYTVIRVKRDVLKSSTIGFTGTNKLLDERMKTTLSTDYVLNLGPLWKLTGQYVAAIDDWNVLRNAGYARFAAENNFFHWHIRYSYTQGDGFKDIFNETGYITDDNRNEFDSDLSYKWWLKNSPIKYISLGTANNWYWNDNFTKFLSWNLNETADIYLLNKLNFGFKYNNEYRFLKSDSIDYYNYYYGVNLGYNTEAYNSARVMFRTGRSFGSDYYSFEAAFQLKILDRLALELRPRYINFTPETASYKTAFINSLSVTYNFTNDLWVKLICQNNTSNDRLYVYGLFGWRFKPPFGNLYLIVNHIEYLDPGGVFQNKYIGYLKLTYPIMIR